MPDKIVTYCGRPVQVACDGNCKKAWGINNRPKLQLSSDENDYAYLADGELGEAPEDPGTYEGGHGKPLSAAYFPNKWCVRECERCSMSTSLVLAVELDDFSKRIFNIPSKHTIGAGQ